MVILTGQAFIDTSGHVPATYSETGTRNIAISVGVVRSDSCCTIQGYQLANNRYADDLLVFAKSAEQLCTAKVLPQEHAAKNKALRQQSAGLPGEEQEDP